MSTCCTAGRQTVWGLVPDGNRTVTALLAGGATRTVPVIDNVYSITPKCKILFVHTEDATGRLVKARAGG